MRKPNVAGRLAVHRLPVADYKNFHKSYLLHLTVHVLLSPWLAVRGLIRARRRDYRRILWQRLLGGSRPSKVGQVVVFAGGLGEVRTARLLVGQSERLAIVTEHDEGMAPDGSVGVAPFTNPVSAWIFLRRWRPKAYRHHRILDQYPLERPGGDLEYPAHCRQRPDL